MLMNLTQNKLLIQMQSDHWHALNNAFSGGFYGFYSLLWHCGIACIWQPSAQAMLRRLPH